MCKFDPLLCRMPGNLGLMSVLMLGAEVFFGQFHS